MLAECTHCLVSREAEMGEELSTKLLPRGCHRSGSSLENTQFTMLAFILPNSEPDQGKKPSSPRVCWQQAGKWLGGSAAWVSSICTHSQERAAQRVERITREQERCSQAFRKDTINSRRLRSSSLHVGLWKSTEKYLRSLNIWPLGDLEALYKQKEKSKADMINCALVTSLCKVEKSLSLLHMCLPTFATALGYTGAEFQCFDILLFCQSPYLSVYKEHGLKVEE